MISRLPFLPLRPGALLAAFMLLVVAWQALPAQALPLQRDHGSAFSAASAEVAVGVREVAAKPVQLPEPLGPPGTAPVFTPRQNTFAADPILPAPSARGPPPRLAIGPVLSPRAPPLA